MNYILLASESPRRSELLARAGIPFIKVPRRRVEVRPQFDPSHPECFAKRLAELKAESAITDEKHLILGCDTIVICEGRLFEKPPTRAEAIKYLTMLQGNRHTVITGIALKDPISGRIESDFEATEVIFSPMTDEEISSYIDTGEPMDKAGAYGIQELGALLVREIHGDYFNVVGLPLFRLTVLLGKFNIKRIEIISCGK